ncbi:MAG: hypothetical protein ACFFAN_00280 [Promethearchaeota archaeon]
MSLKETIQSKYDNIAADINQLNNCRIYWVKFFQQEERKRKIIMVKVIAEKKDFDYKMIKNFIITKLFREAKERLASICKLKNTLITR